MASGRNKLNEDWGRRRRETVDERNQGKIVELPKSTLGNRSRGSTRVFSGPILVTALLSASVRE
jgi:hypothetical protein